MNYQIVHDFYLYRKINLVIRAIVSKVNGLFKRDVQVIFIIV